MLAVILVYYSVGCKSQDKSSSKGVWSFFQDTSEAYAKKIDEILEKAKTRATIDLENQMMNLLAEVYDRQMIEPTISYFVEKHFYDSPKQVRIETRDKLVEVISAELYLRGLTRFGEASPRFTWADISRENDKVFAKVPFLPSGPKIRRLDIDKTYFQDANFVQAFLKVTHGKISKGYNHELLIDGKASFRKRAQILKSAQKRIYVASWAIYDDETGHEFVNELIAKHRAGVDVRVMVDGKTASRLHYDKAVVLLAREGVPLIRWDHPAYPYHGMHRKMMIVDDIHMIVGGLNVGNFYSHHEVNKLSDNWRDTDFYVQGPIVVDALHAFQYSWNAIRIAMGNKLGAHVKPIENEVLDEAKKANSYFSGAGESMQLIDHEPSQIRADYIYRATLLAVRAATKSIKINNAYFIMTPPLKEALIDAVKRRGVSLEIITNSAASVDEPIVVQPILESLPDLIDAGARVYLKQGSTLHTKSFLVDDYWGWIGSYNLHPRSLYFEVESVLSFFSKNLGREFAQMFDDDKNLCQSIINSSDLQIPVTTGSKLATYFFYNQL